MVDEISLLALHVLRILASIFAHLRGWSLIIMVSLHDMWDRGQCARRALHSVGYDVGTSNITMVMVILCVSIVNISTGVVRANVR